MSFFEDASLVLIPSAQKTSKVYSVKPTDGTGDLAFTRSNDTATRVGPDGLIEKVRTNLQNYSQDFTNAVWVPDLVSITGGQSDPNGGTTAALVTATASSSVYFYSSSTTVGTYSIYAKAGSRSNFSILNGVYNNGASFNLATQTATAYGQGSLAKIEDVGGGWFRCSVYISSASLFLIALSDITGGGMNSGDTMYFAFAQRETGDIATDYIATTTAAVSVGPVANVPRLDYLNSSCPRLLLEPQRTNYATYNEAFSNWSTTAGTITSNATTSPDGYVDADLFTEDTTTGYHRFANSCTGATGTTKTYSVYAKWAGGTGRKWLTIDNGPISYFDLENGVLGISGANCTSSITAVGNGWYRCVVTHTASIYATLFIGSSNVNGGAGNHLGNGQPAFYVWGAQCEDNASYATSVIPTLGAAVTRGADFPVNLPTAISLSGDFSLFWEGTAFETDLMLYGSGNSTWYVNILGAAGRVVLDTNTGRKVQGTSASLVIGTKAKVLIRRQSGAHNIFVNGVKLTNQVSVNDTTTLSLSSMFWGVSSTFYKGQTVNQSLIFQTALSDADCIALTA